MRARGAAIALALGAARATENFTPTCQARCVFHPRARAAGAGATSSPPPPAPSITSWVPPFPIGNGTWNNATYDLVAPTCNQPNFNSVCAVYGSAQCCTAAYTNDVTASESRIYPGWSFDQCPIEQPRGISARCRRFHEYQECSYGCDPNPLFTRMYQGLPGAPAVPLCAAYCDEWYDSCKNDYTCNDVWKAFVPGGWPTEPANNSLGYKFSSCASGQAANPPTLGKCRTYEDVFGSGKEMCTRLWSPATYNYSTDTSTCRSLGPSLTGACFPGLPQPPAVSAACPAAPAAPFTRASDGASAAGCAAAAAPGVDVVGAGIGGGVGGVVVVLAVGACVAARCRGATPSSTGKEVMAA